MSVKSFARTHLGNGVVKALANLRAELHILLLHRISSRKVPRILVNSPLKLNCGCGSNRKAGWINIDLTEKNADLRLDLRTRFPFPDLSASFIYSEHFFEHLEFPTETDMFLRESLRVLIPGGRFRVGVPDTEWPLNSYVQRDDAYFQFARQHWHPAYCNTRLHSINYHFRQGSEHKYAYDLETLTTLLSESGFVGIERSEFDPSLDSEHRKLGTLYVNASKG